MKQIDLPHSEFRPLPAPKREKLSFFEALSFSIASTLATRPEQPVDPERKAARARALWMGIAWYVSHHWFGS